MKFQRTLSVSLSATLLLLLASLVATPAFAVPTVSTDKSSYKQGELVTISGTGAVANGLVGVEVKDSKGALAFSTIVTASATGTFSATFRLRADAPLGTWSVSATDSTGTSGPATFTVVQAATLTLKPTNAPPGASVSFSGSGYTAGSTLRLTLAWGPLTINLTSGSVGAGGSISGSFAVPGVAAGIYTITASDGAGITGTASFGVEQAITANDLVAVRVTSPAWAVQGTKIKILILVTVNGVNTDADVSASHVWDPDNTKAGIGDAATRVAPGHYIVEYTVPAKPGTYHFHGVAKAAGFVQYGASATLVVGEPFATVSALNTAVSDLGKKIDSAQSAITGAVSGAQSAVNNAVSAAQSAISSAVNTATGAVGSKVDGLVSQVGQVNSFVLTVAVIAIITLVIEVVILLRVRK